MFKFLIPLLTISSIALAQPNIEQQLLLHDSLVQVSVELENGISGTGTGVVVDKEFVATNCHVIANGKGVSVNKYGDAFKPIAIRADWKHDLCLLRFEGLPFKPVVMRESANLLYEEQVFAIGYPNGFNVPQPSFGTVKALYALDNSFIIRSNAAISLGSSGGGLFDQQSRLVGITTFKSPGPQGFYYSVPVEWIQQLLKSNDIDSLNTTEIPFWAKKLEDRPYFMQVVIPYQNREWENLKQLSQSWLNQSNSLDAMYFLALAEINLSQKSQAKQHLQKILQSNHRHLDAIHLLTDIAVEDKDKALLDNLEKFLTEYDDPDELQDFKQKLLVQGETKS